MNRSDTWGSGSSRDRLVAGWGAATVGLILLTLGWTAATRPAPLDPSVPSVPTTTPATVPMRSVGAREAAQYLQFEPNRGQASPAVRYLSRGPAHSIEVFDDGMSLSTPRRSAPLGAAAAFQSGQAQLRFTGTTGSARFEAREAAQGHANYLLDVPSNWIRDVPRYHQLRQADLYPGIDLVYYSRQGELEFDLVVKPGADPSRIRMHLGGAEVPVIAANGDLLLDGAEGALRLHRPVLYQNIDGEKRVLDARFVLDAERELGFDLPGYDTRYPLVIDPVFKLLYSTYVTGFHDEQVGGMALDAQGNAYVVGRTTSDDFVVSANAYQTRKSTTGLQYNVVVTKFDASGALVYSSYLGGGGSDIGSAIAVDAAGNAYVTGNTTSPDFPVTVGAFQSVSKGSPSAFLSILSPDGSALGYSSYYGGAGATQALSIALDANGAPVLVGYAGPGLPTTAGAWKTTLATGAAAFVARFSPLSSGPPQLQAASYFGVDNPQANSSGQGNTGFALALDSAGAVWFTGQAYTTNLPVTAAAVQASPPAIAPACAPGPGPLNSFAYVAKLSADLGTLAYASYLSGKTEPSGGAACAEFGRAIAIDSTDSVYVTGATASASFPTTAGAPQTAFPSGLGTASYTGFVTKLKADGSAVLWSTYLGGNGGNTFPGAIAIDAAASAIWTTSVTGGGSNYPTTVGALQPVHGGGGADAGIAQLDAATGALKYSTFLGGNSADVGLALAVDAGGNAFVAGNTFSPNFPVTPNAFESAFRPDFFGGADWFFAVIGQASIGSVKPSRASNTGDVSVAVRGAGFAAGTTCRLEGSVAIDAVATQVTPDGTSIRCTFALDAKPAGDYAVVIVLPDGSRINAPRPLTVDADGGDADIWATIIGRAKIRAGVAAPYEVTYGNRGKVDAYGVMMAISWPKGVTVTRKFEFEKLPDMPIADPNASAPDVIEKDGRMNLLVFVPKVSAGQTFSLPFEVIAPLDVPGVRLQVKLARPMATSIAAFNAAFAVPANAVGHADALSLRAKPLQTAAQSQACITQVVLAAVSFVQTTPLGNCASSVTGLIFSLGVLGAQNNGPNAFGTGNAVNFGSMLLSGGQALLSCVALGVPGVAAVVTVLAAANFLLSAVSALDACAPVINGAIAQIEAALSIDPNYKSGPVGDGSPSHFVRSVGPSGYQIGFENLAGASLPAAQVVVTDVLDSAKFDLATLTLGSITFGTTRIAVPTGLTSYATTYPIDSTMALRVQGSLNPSTGVLKWTFTTLDPVTGLPPSDPTRGFLPPNKDGVQGQAYVNFTVAPKSGLADGSVWSNSASIVFDANVPIVTPLWTNTLDISSPTSRVQSVTAQSGSSALDVAWSGSDAGSGPKSFTVYVSDNGGPFAPWQTDVSTTAATYGGTAGHVYGFYVIATDGAGNIETAKSAAEASQTASDAGVASSGGGCTLGGPGQRDATLPLLLLTALGVLLRRRYRATQALAA